MSHTYEIILLIGRIDTSSCPPPMVKTIFPNFLNETVQVDEKSCRVTFDQPQTPVDLGPLVLVKEVTL